MNKHPIGVVFLVNERVDDALRTVEHARLVQMAKDGRREQGERKLVALRTGGMQGWPAGQLAAFAKLPRTTWRVIRSWFTFKVENCFSQTSLKRASTSLLICS